MPHFGLIDEANLPEEEVLLMRARLHLRSGRRRLQEGKLEDAVAVLYDAVLSGMQWAALTSDWLPKEGAGRQDEILADEQRLYELLVRHGVWHQPLNFQELRMQVDQAMQGELLEFDRRGLMTRIEGLMTVLGVMPFDEHELPPELPGVF